MDVTENGTYTPITKLSALDDLFMATGTALVKVTRGSEERLLEIPIQSVDVEEVNHIAGLPPRVPRMATGGTPKFAPDHENPEYLLKQQIYNRRYVMALACMGIAVDIEDKQGTVVWSADNKVRDLDKAQDALKAMGLVYNQLFAITRAISDLTTIAEEQAASD